jgi:hypothetical protein
MDAVKTSDQINHDRRRSVGAAAVGIGALWTLGLLPEPTVAATDADAIRPFRINVPEASRREP